MGAFERQLKSKQAGINIGLNKHRKLFVSSEAPSVRHKVSRNRTSVSFTIGRRELRDHIGYIEGHVDYEMSHEELISIEYSFKFFSNIDTLVISVGGRPKKPRPYGFRFEKSSIHKGWGHPEMHLQFEYSSKPRFAQYYKFEVDALEGFMATVRETFCREPGYDIEYTSIVKTQ